MTLPESDRETIRQQVDSLLASVYWGVFQERGLENEKIPTGLVVDRGGDVLECSAAPVVDEDLRVQLCGTITGTVFHGLTQGGAGQVNAVWDGSVPAIAVPDDDRNTHMCEAAPPPYERYGDPNLAWKKKGPKD